MSQPAAVIDLDAFRRERQVRAERSCRPPRPAAPICVVPVLVTWVPVWPVR